MVTILPVICTIIVALLSSLAAAQNTGGDPVNLIIDTDLLSWPDDVGAIGISNVLQRQGKVRILGIVSDVCSRYSIPAIDAINTYYHYPNIPFAQNHPISNDTSEVQATPNNPVYVTALANHTRFPEDIHDGLNSTISDPLSFYRGILQNASDNSVKILSIGFFTNLGELYNSEGGKALIAKKVKELVVQGGTFNGSTPGYIGYNLRYNFDAAKVLVDWPSPVTFLGRDVGASVLSGSVLKNTSASNPVKAAYEIFLGSPGKDNGSWDLLAAYYTIMSNSSSFKYGNTNGRIKIINSTTVVWDFDAVVPESRRQRFLLLNEANTTVADKLNNLLAFDPNK